MTGQPFGAGTYDANLVAAAVELYRREGHTPDDLLLLVADIARLQASNFEQLGALSVCGADDGAHDGAMDRAPSVVSPPEQWLRDALKGTIDIFVTHSPQAEDGLRSLAAHLDSQSPSALAAAARGDAAALDAAVGETGLTPAVVLFVLRAAIQPYFAWRFAPDPSLPLIGTFPVRKQCPACGGQPSMGKHAEPDGHRFLRCGVCGYEWAYPRLACVSCGETDQGKLEALFVDGDEGHRLYVCNSCNQYIKISDERLLGRAVYLPLEDIVTLRLDEFARQRGFAPVGEESGVQAAQGTNRVH
jgi:formate dehydrogenase maturation protein FdhE